uniref:F5/8 type C domain-containing protein n=1 Tax=Plectus sambesii TaxID=2011161 RepID=A0A914V9L0_9BILA
MSIPDMIGHEEDSAALNKPWVAWHKHAAGSTIELLFEFESVRNFSSIRFHTFNRNQLGISVFDSAKFSFSLDGVRYPSAAVLLISGITDDDENLHWLTVPMRHRLGRFVKLELRYSNDWLFLSEIQFNSSLFIGNATDAIV